MSESEVLELPLDKFFLYQEAESRRRIYERKALVMDTAQAIGGAFGKDGISAYLKHLDGA